MREVGAERGAGGGGSQLLERERELAEIASAIERAEAGKGGMLLIQGERGVGKTALLRATRERAREREFAVLEARGSALEREFPGGSGGGVLAAAAALRLRGAVLRRG